MSLKSSEKGQHRKAKYAKCHWDFFSLPVLWLLPQRLLLSNLSSFVEAHNKEIMVRWCADLRSPASSLSCISRSQVRRRNTLISAKRDTFTQGKQNQRATPYDAHSCPYMPHVLIMNPENHGNEIKTHRSNRGVPGWQKKSLLVCRWINKFSETLAGDQNEYVKDFFADFKGLQSHKV